MHQTPWGKGKRYTKNGATKLDGHWLAMRSSVRMVAAGWGGPNLINLITKSCGRYWHWELSVDGEGCAGAASWVHVRLRAAALRLRTAAPCVTSCLFPPRLVCPWGPWGCSQKFHSCVWRDCEDAEAWNSCTFSSRGCPLIGRGSVTRSPLQYRTQGDSSEPPFS